MLGGRVVALKERARKEGRSEALTQEMGELAADIGALSALHDFFTTTELRP